MPSCVTDNFSHLPHNFLRHSTHTHTLTSNIIRKVFFSSFWMLCHLCSDPDIEKREYMSSHVCIIGSIGAAEWADSIKHNENCPGFSFFIVFFDCVGLKFVNVAYGCCRKWSRLLSFFSHNRFSQFFLLGVSGSCHKIPSKILCTSAHWDT